MHKDEDCKNKYIRVNIDVIVCESEYIDEKVVVRDMIDFISRSQTIPCTPTVIVCDNKLHAVDCVICIRCAKESVPRIHDIVCVTRDEKALSVPGVKEVGIIDLLRQDRNKKEDDVAYLYFSKDIDTTTVDIVEKLFGKKVHKHIHCDDRSILCWTPERDTYSKQGQKEVGGLMALHDLNIHATSWCGIEIMALKQTSSAIAQ
jgi:hypothetical protein